MSMVIANNMSAVNTKRQFSTSARGMGGAMEKLSSGYKINTGKDDPSGLVISEKLRSQLNGLKRAQQNTEEAINVMGIAEGALNEMNAILKKMKALAIHSNNTGVTSPDQIAADQAEMDSSIQTLDRIAQTTKFSEENLLNGAKDIAFDATTSTKGTQQNSLLNTRETSFSQIFKRDDYAVAISFTGTASADEVTGLGAVDFTKQTAKAYLEVDTSKDAANAAQVADGKFIQQQSFTLTGTKGSRAFTFDRGETVATMVNQIKSVADSTGIDAALVFNSDQKIDFTTNANGTTAVAAATTFDMGGVTFSLEPTEDLAAEFDAGGACAANGLKFQLSYTDISDPDDMKVDLTVSTDGGTTYTTITSGWDGKAATLQDAISRNANNTPQLALLADALTAGGDLSATGIQGDLNFGTLAGADLGTITVENIFGAAVDGAVNGKLTVDLSGSNINLQTVYDSLSDDMKASFAADAADGFHVEASMEGTMEDMRINLSLVGDSGTVYKSHIYDPDESAVAFGDNGTNLGADAGTATVATANTMFAGATITLTNLDRVAYAAGDPVNGAAGVSGSIKAPGYSGGKTTINGLRVAAAANTTLGAVAAAATITNLKTAAAASVTFSAMTTAGSALDGEDVKFAFVVDPNQDAAAGDPTMRLVATHGANEYTIATGLTTGTSLVTQLADASKRLTAAQIYASGGTPVGEEAVADALAALTFSLNGAVGTDVVAAGYIGSTLNGTDAISAADDSGLYAESYDNLTTGAITVADNLYGAGLGGKIEIKFDDFDISEAFGAAADLALIASKLGTTTGLSFTATVEPDITDDGKWNLAITASNGTDSLLLGSITFDDLITASGSANLTGSNPPGSTVGTTDADANGWVFFGSSDTGGDGFAYTSDAGVSTDGVYIRITMPDELPGYRANKTDAINNTSTSSSAAVTITPTEAVPVSEEAEVEGFATAGAAAQIGGMDIDSVGAERQAGSVAIFNNQLVTDAETGKTTGTVSKGITSLAIDSDGKEAIQLGMNTDGQGRIYVKFIDDGSFELYKDASLSEESKVATGVNGKEISQYNNSGLEGITLNITGTELTKVKGVYFTVAGIEGKSTVNGNDGVAYNGDVVGTAGTALFDASKTLMTGVELGKNTDADGKIHLESIYDAKAGTVQVKAYKDANKRPEDLVAESELFDVSAFATASTGSMTIVLNEKRNADDTAGTGLGIVLSTDTAIFANLKADDKNVTSESVIEFKNLGARIYSQDYGSDQFIKLTQEKGNVFHYYAAAGDNDSKRMVDAGEKGVTVQVNGQDATLSVNGTQVKTNGLELSMATQDIQANLVFNQGKVGSTTLAQVGYETASIFTKVGALNLGSVDAEETGKYAGLSGLMANAGHVTNERVDNFQGGMQLQLGEGAGDQNRTMVAIKSMTSENLGRVTKGGYWDADAVYTEKTFTMKDVFGGGVASLKQRPTLAMEIIEQAIADVSEMRAQIGAVQTNMLQTNSNNLAVTMENIQKTESGIRDADMADEMTDFTKNQVLQNAAMSMMSQANQSSQNVLQLLR